jgi:hypothetical protein
MPLALEQLTGPTLNMNGTSRVELLRQYLEAFEAANKLAEKLANMAPHGRDYPLGDETYAQAVKQHNARRDAVRSIIAEIEHLAERL